MSLDSSLRAKAGMSRHRNVLSRAERIEKLVDQEKWRDGRSVYGLPKVPHRKVVVGGKKKKAKGEEGADAAEPAKK
jgi:small basic protein (TIGR04137 family)